MKKEVFENCVLYLGDCRDIEPVIKYQSLVTDPPYGMSFQSNHRKEKHFFTVAGNIKQTDT